ncbi:redoxin domain-containing protein [bacterium]|nr:redoxin domain-containing protein [bacterium]
MRAIVVTVIAVFAVTQVWGQATSNSEGGLTLIDVQQIMERIRQFPFSPVFDGRSQDPVLKRDGSADYRDASWLTRLIAIRDLARAGSAAVPALISALQDENEHVRHVAAFALGLNPAEGAEDALIDLLRRDADPIVRSQAVLSLSQIKSQRALPFLEQLAKDDPSRDVRHQCELAVYRITKYSVPGADLSAAYADLDESMFGTIRVGQQAIDFELTDTEGDTWRLSDFRGKKDVVLIWVFADWCPVCHNEFHELIELKKFFQEQNVEVVTLECHDPYRCRVMVGREFQPDYWFSETSPQDAYQGKIWWRHLIDLAGAVGATYGVQPLAFAVHAEWINRPATVIIDKDGIVQFAYYGTFWGDRPSIQQTFDMIQTGQFNFEHPKRLKLP